jgi:hypothetical protein
LIIYALFLLSITLCSIVEVCVNYLFLAGVVDCLLDTRIFSIVYLAWSSL